jgi:putative transposase
MSRHRRLVLPGQPQHVIQRGINQDIIFIDEADYRFYLDSLKQACQRNHCRLHAYVLMTNHVLCGAPHNACNVKFNIM